VEKAHRLFIGAADHLINHLAELLSAENFARVQAAIDPDHGLALFGQSARLVKEGKAVVWIDGGLHASEVQTTALPSLAKARAWSSVRSPASASRREISL